MQPSQRARAVAAATSVASSLDLPVDASTVLHDSNALTLRLLPCDVLARVAPVAPVATQGAELEVDLALRLAGVGGPVALPDPRVPPRAHEQDGSVITSWTYYEPTSDQPPPAADYAGALVELHAAPRGVEVRAPHVTDSVRTAERLLADKRAHPRTGRRRPRPAPADPGPDEQRGGRARRRAAAAR